MTSILFNDFSSAIEFMESNQWTYFTKERGRKPYHFWVPGRCGCYYAYRCMPSGHAGCRRQFENNEKVRVYYEEAS